MPLCIARSQKQISQLKDAMQESESKQSQLTAQTEQQRREVASKTQVSRDSSCCAVVVHVATQL